MSVSSSANWISRKTFLIGSLFTLKLEEPVVHSHKVRKNLRASTNRPGAGSKIGKWVWGISDVRNRFGNQERLQPKRQGE